MAIAAPLLPEGRDVFGRLHSGGKRVQDWVIVMNVHTFWVGQNLGQALGAAGVGGLDLAS